MSTSVVDLEFPVKFWKESFFHRVNGQDWNLDIKLCGSCGKLNEKNGALDKTV